MVDSSTKGSCRPKSTLEAVEDLDFFDTRKVMPLTELNGDKKNHVADPNCQFSLIWFGLTLPSKLVGVKSDFR